MKENGRDSLIYHKEAVDLLIEILKDHKVNPKPKKDYIIECKGPLERYYRSMHFNSIARSFDLLARWLPGRNEAVLRNGALVKFKRKKEAK